MALALTVRRFFDRRSVKALNALVVMASCIYNVHVHTSLHACHTNDCQYAGCNLHCGLVMQHRNKKWALTQNCEC